MPSTPIATQSATGRRTRRQKLELTWVVGVVIFTVARFGAAWGALADQHRWVVWIFGAIDLGTAVPYAVGTSRLVTSAVDRNAQSMARWGLVAAVSFLAPYLWLGWAGRDGEFPVVVYVVVAICLVLFGLNAILGVRRKVREQRSQEDQPGSGSSGSPHVVLD